MKCCIMTYTGRTVNPLDVKLHDICIEDIAHSLACINRFNGHLSRPVSVAQHSVYVSRLAEELYSSEYTEVSKMIALQGLLHDGSEAYLGDMTKWLKNTDEMKSYRDAEDRCQDTIYAKFGCFLKMYKEVELADRIMVRFEGKLIPNFKIDHPNYPELTADELSLIGKWSPWSWKQAEEAFLVRFGVLSASY